MTTGRCPAGTIKIEAGNVTYGVVEFSSGVSKPAGTRSAEVDSFCITPRIPWGEFRRSKIYRFMKPADKQTVDQLNGKSSNGDDVRGVPWNRAIGHCELKFGSFGSMPSEEQWHRANNARPLAQDKSKMDLVSTSPRNASRNDALRIGTSHGAKLMHDVIDKDAASRASVFRCVVPAK